MAEKPRLIAINPGKHATTFDVIAVPAIGADPDETWRFQARRTRTHFFERRAFSPNRLRSRSRSRGEETSASSTGMGPSIFDKVDGASIYLYKHIELQKGEQRELPYFTRAFLRSIMEMPHLGDRPICFAAHSTGGLVVKQMLIAASMHTENVRATSIVRRCFGVSFFGTPHYGSTILSEENQKDNVARILRLDAPMSDLLRLEMSSDSIADLERINRDFSMVALSFNKIWSFWEGQQTELTVSGTSMVKDDDSDGGTEAHSKTRASRFFQTPIVDKRSAVLSSGEVEIGVEEVVEIKTRHSLLSTFGGQDQSITYKNYVDDLTRLASELSGKEAKDLEDLSKKIFTEVNLFYESSQAKRKSFIKLWSEFPALYDLCEKGPERCLEERRSGPAKLNDTRPVERRAISAKRKTTAWSRLANHLRDKQIEEDTAAGPSPVQDSTKHAEAQVEGVPEIVVTFVDDSDLIAARPSDSMAIPTPVDVITESEHIVSRDPNDGFDDNVEFVRKSVKRARKKKKFEAQGLATESSGDSKQSTERTADKVESESQSSSASALISTADFFAASRPRRRDAYAEMMEDFENYYNEKTPDAAEFFAPDDLKASVGEQLEVRPGARSIERSQLNEETSGLQRSATDDAWSAILKSGDTELHKRREKQAVGTDFTMPSKERVKFRWIHVPSNNMLFWPAILQALAIEMKEPSLQRALLHRKAFNSLQHVPRHKSSHGRFMRPSCLPFVPEQYSSIDSTLSALGLHSPIEDMQMCLFFPYLHWDTLGDLKARNELSARRRQQGKPYPVEHEMYNSSLEHQLIWFYLNSASELPLHLRRSLDQYGYPNLSNTSARDMDQILSKRTGSRKKRSKGLQTQLAQMWDTERRKAKKKIFWEKEDLKTGDLDEQSRVLMVDTMWLWIVGKGSVVTFFPARRHGRTGTSRNDFNASDVHDRIYDDVNGDPRFARQCQNCFDFAALAILHASQALLQSNDDPDLQVFGIFEEYLSELTEQQTKSFKEFRDSQLVAETNEGEQAIRQMMLNLHNRDDLTNLLELRDISDELRTLDKLFVEQLKVIEQMLDLSHRLDRIGLDPKHIDGADEGFRLARQWLHEAHDSIDGYASQSKDMQQRCESVQDAYKLLLDMKQKQANVAEASLSRLSAEVASEQNRAIMIFTIFTIIFLPLSFFTSLFGMNVKEWSGENTNPDFHEVFLIAGCISAGIVIIALTLAFNRPIRLKVVSLFKRSIKHWPTKAARLTYRKLLGACIGKKQLASGPKGPNALSDLERGASGEAKAGDKVPNPDIHKLFSD